MNHFLAMAHDPECISNGSLARKQTLCPNIRLETPPLLLLPPLSWESAGERDSRYAESRSRLIMPSRPSTSETTPCQSQSRFAWNLKNTSSACQTSTS